MFWKNVKDTKEPLRQNRWFLRFAASEGGIDESIIVALKECKKPKYDVTITEHKLINYTFKYPGVIKWAPIDIKLVSIRGDKGEKDVSFMLYNLLIKSGYTPPQYITEATNIYGLTKSKSSKYLASNSLDIIQIDEDGNEVEVWKVYNPIVASVDYGQLTYENDGFVDVSLQIQYDWAELEVTNTKVELGLEQTKNIEAKTETTPTAETFTAEAAIDATTPTPPADTASEAPIEAKSTTTISAYTSAAARIEAKAPTPPPSANSGSEAPIEARSTITIAPASQQPVRPPPNPPNSGGGGMIAVTVNGQRRMMTQKEYDDYVRQLGLDF